MSTRRRRSSGKTAIASFAFVSASIVLDTASKRSVSDLASRHLSIKTKARCESAVDRSPVWKTSACWNSRRSRPRGSGVSRGMPNSRRTRSKKTWSSFHSTTRAQRAAAPSPAQSEMRISSRERMAWRSALVLDEAMESIASSRDSASHPGLARAESGSRRSLLSRKKPTRSATIRRSESGSPKSWRYIAASSVEKTKCPRARSRSQSSASGGRSAGE